MQPGAATGFLQAYGLISGVQDRKQARADDAQRYEDQQQYRQQALGLQRSEADYQHKRDVVGDQRWDKQFEAKRADQSIVNDHWDKGYGLKQDALAQDKVQSDRDYGLSAAKAGAAIRSSNASAQADEIKVSDAKRQAEEQNNQRYLTAAGQELQANGPTPKFAQMAQQGGIDVSNMLNPKWQQSSQTIHAALGGAPIRKEKMIEAGNTYFADRIDKVVGGKTKNGDTIVRAQLDNFVPSEDGNDLHLGLKVWAKGKNGHVYEYKAPVTSNRSSGDGVVLNVPMQKVVAHIKGMDLLNKATDKQQLATSLQEAQTLNGSGDLSDENTGKLIKMGDNAVINNKTGKRTVYKPVVDEKQRYAKAYGYAQKQLEAVQGNMAHSWLTIDEKEKELPQAQQDKIKEARIRKFTMDARNRGYVIVNS